MLAGGGGAGTNGNPEAKPLNGSPGSGAAHANASDTFPGAPVTQRNGDGVESGYCPLASPNPYLPAHSGCVTVRRADINGDGRNDLIIAYSILDPKPPRQQDGELAVMRGFFHAREPFLRVVLVNGSTLTSRVAGASLHAAAIDAVARLNALPGDEIVLQVGRTSSGATDVAYGYQAGQLVSAGAYLGYGGDSASGAGVECVGGSRPLLIQRTYDLLGSRIAGPWKETTVTYAWRALRLVRIGQRSFRRLGPITNRDERIGRGCTHGIG
jgi:hypothetical protein